MDSKNLPTREELVKQINKTNRLLVRFTSLKQALLRGIFTGVGWSIGTTIVIAVLLWVMAQLQYVPFIGDISNYILETIEQGTQVQTPDTNN